MTTNADSLIEEFPLDGTEIVAVKTGAGKARRATTGNIAMATNLGEGDAEIFASKSGNTLRFRSFNTTSGNMSINQNSASIFLDVTPGAIDHDALMNSGGVKHIDWTNSSSNFKTTGTWNIGDKIYVNSSNPHLGIGQSSTSNSVTVAGFPFTAALMLRQDGLNNLAQITSLRSDSTLAGNGSPLIFGRSRGATGSESAVQSGDNLWTFSIVGHDGTDYNIAAQISADITNTVSNNVTPASFRFRVQPDAGGTVVERLALNSGAESVFNEPGADHDYRFEGDNDANLVFTDAGNDRVGIGTNAPGSKLDVNGSFQCNSITNNTGLAAGTYTPTLTNVTNVAASTAYPCQYMRVGNTVTVSGKIDIDVTTGAAAMEVGISLPIASNFANNYECGGCAYAATVARDGFAINADATNDRARAVGFIVNAANQTFFFSFTYRVI